MRYVSYWLYNLIYGRKMDRNYNKFRSRARDDGENALI
jgi:hypothetical protein